MASRVNLDALIPREDFQVLGQDPDTPVDAAFKIYELEQRSPTRTVLRKPDFQRETNHWTPVNIADFIKSFVELDLIPNLILWRSPHTGNIFVIDGAHRLSALIAWTHNDYGDGDLSRTFADNRIPDEQLRAAEATRKLVNKTVGPYQSVKLALDRPDTSTEDQTRWAKNMVAAQIKSQWVGGDAAKAEKSFYAINMKATPIDPVEMKMIEDRRKPNALAARALIHAGTGHQYWSRFPSEIQQTIRETARSVYDMLFEPELTEPIKTLDLPVAGKPYTAESVKMLFDFVDFANRNRRRVGSERVMFGGKTAALKPLEEDNSGEETVEYLRAVRKKVQTITGTYPGSLGLHPAVYYYSATGKRQPSAFLAAISFVEDLDHKSALNTFTDHRADFEEFLIRYKHFLNQISKKYGSNERSLRPIVDLYQCVLVGLKQNLDDDAIVLKIKQNPSLKFLQPHVEESGVEGAEFQRSQKSQAFLASALQGATRCHICGARVHRNSMTIDHIERRADGGTNASSNGAVTHPYCNSGYKESGHPRSRRATT